MGQILARATGKTQKAPGFVWLGYYPDWDKPNKKKVRAELWDGQVLGLSPNSFASPICIITLSVQVHFRKSLS